MFSSKNKDGKIDIIWSDIDSSMIDFMHFHFEQNQGLLGVVFKSGEGYIYRNVQIKNVIDLLKSESVGSEFSKSIRMSFPYQNIGKTEGISPLIKLGINVEI